MKHLTLLISLLLASIAHAQIHVSVGGTGNGSSWVDACSLEQAMTLATSGTQVWVQQGAYYPSATLRVPSGVLMYGGFSGNETTLSQRNYAKNTTIIDGQHAFAVVRLGNGAVLDGFAVINGLSNLLPTPYGGGVWMEPNARVENCQILDNHAGQYGGGIYAEGDGLVYNTLFSGNVAGVDGLVIWGTTLEVRNITASQNRLWDDPIILDENRCNVAVPAWFVLGTADFVSDSVWLADTLLWSDAVAVNTCNKTVYNGGSNSPPTFHSDCRSNPNQKGDLFSWCAVKRFGDELCPKPWRVPILEEFAALNQDFGGTGANNQTSLTTIQNYLNFWGGTYSGYSSPAGLLTEQNTGAFYWSQTEVDLTSGFGQSFYSNGLVFPRLTAEKSYGYALRCVHTCPHIITNLTSGEGTRTQAVCQHLPIAAVTHTWGGGATQATLSWDIIPEGITGDEESFSGTPTTPGVYRWTITTVGDNICPQRIDTGSITVHALPATVTVTGETPACDSTILTASNGNDGTIYWQSTTSNGTCGDVACRISTQTVKTSGTYYFRAQSAEGCWGAQGSLEVVINTPPIIILHPNTIARSVNIANRDTFPRLSVRATSTFPLSYQWYYNTERSTIGATLIVGATDSTYT
ncbi:MAG: hypothetical protein LBP96_04430, partial [Bacteroidales bacterium]|nr:hypothetical protein [Bacteroidales bacterium]